MANATHKIRGMRSVATRMFAVYCTSQIPEKKIPGNRNAGSAAPITPARHRMTTRHQKQIKIQQLYSTPQKPCNHTGTYYTASILNANWPANQLQTTAPRPSLIQQPLVAGTPSYIPHKHTHTLCTQTSTSYSNTHTYTHHTTVCNDVCHPQIPSCLRHAEDVQHRG